LNKARFSLAGVGRRSPIRLPRTLAEAMEVLEIVVDYRDSKVGAVIICSCNVLSEADILETLKSESSAKPRSPVAAYRCLGCAPRCGRCLATVRALLAEARIADCQVGCPTCPGAEHAHEHDSEPERWLIAAE
jgi:bacterioferritin-associated ferredoxin